jgi:uncharacterized protein
MPEAIDVRGELKKLIELQGVDLEMFELKSELDSFPARLAEMDASLETKKSGMNAAEQELKRLQVLKNEKETDMQEREEKIKKHEGDLYQIKNNKEYQALQQEINSIRADVSIIEDAIIGLFDQIESAQAAFAEEKRKFEEEGVAVEKEKTVIRQEEQAMRSQLTGLESKRSDLAGSVSPEILSQYQRILDKWGKAAIAVVKGEFCGECNMQLRPQIMNEANLKKELILCESCGRILYAED